MAKKQGSRLRALFSRVFQFRFWFDVARLQTFTQYLLALFKRFFVPAPKEAEESFDAAKKRLKLTNAQLLERQQALFRTSIFMLVIVGLLVCYAFYQILAGGMLAVFVTLVLILIALALSFRYHFWYFQIKTKQLGCSWKVWFNEGLLGGKKE